MASVPNADILVDTLIKLCAEEGADDAYEIALATALQALQVDTVTRLRGWSNSCLMSVPCIPADISRFRQQLITAAAPGTLADDVTTRTVVAGLVGRLPAMMTAYEKAMEPAAAAAAPLAPKALSVSADKQE